MKKILLTLMAALGFATSSNAQLQSGTIFPDFTLTSITGQTLHLYSLLDSGYTVFIDISATWCNPCWNYHTGHHLDSLYEQHGPTGWSGVNATTTNNVVVIFVQGEPTSSLAELYAGPGSTPGSSSVETPANTCTQGNWVAGTPYPIVDDTTSTDPVVGTNALDATWSIAYFPTVYMICRDHILQVLDQPTAVDAYADAQATCPNYPPSATVNAKATSYSGPGYFVCTANPTSASFQNYGTNTITSATITVTDASGSTLSTVPWTGSLAPYDIAAVPLSSFTGTSFGGYKYSVSAPGDSYAADNGSADSIFKVYDVSNATAIPYSENFETATNAYKYYLPDPKGYTIISNQLVNPSNTATSINIIGSSGTPTTALWFDNYDATHAGALSNYTTQFIFGNYNISKSSLSFDESYAPKSGSSVSDELEVLVSTDCGSTWNTAWSASGATLSSASAITSNWFVPSAASQWKHFTVNLDSFANDNMMIELASVTATANNGELLYVDNLNFTNTTAVPQVTVNGDVTIYPNPAKDIATINMNLNAASHVNVQVIDALGRVLKTIDQDVNAGSQNIELSTSDLSSGLYNVKINAGTTVSIKQLTVIK